ncbi:MAG: TMEM43 family protein [Deltaproteobacteria bacterium]|nr:TMEM43 family protein [Deltaproteobacteria bacterium]
MTKITVSSRQSWVSRLGQSIGGVIVGLLLLVGGLVLLWWNEGRAVITAKALEEGAGLVVSVAADRVDPVNEGRLVHVAGRAQVEGLLADPDFPFVSAPALILERRVEMFQWREDQETREVKKLGGSVETETTYTYRKVWSGSLYSSSRFYDSAGHSNPSSLPYSDLTLKASGARLGAFSLPQDLLNLSATETLRVPENAPLEGRGQASAGGIYLGNNPNAPEIGDVRIQYAYAPMQDVSVVARQTGDSFDAFPVSGGKRSLQMLKPGLADAAAIFEDAHTENMILTWILRAAGTLLGLCLGLYLVFRPLSVAGDVIPALGSLLGIGLGLAAFFLGLAIALLVIALAWLFYRPLLGIFMLAAAAATAYGLRALAKRRELPASNPSAR